ncbi:MAG TPA: hypothetical protein VLB80_04770 [Candidatus Babeliales bacterium]|nr:hypothetical protein [Candidatus Babeliales bacterium]
MKKKFIMLSTLLIMASGLYGATYIEVINRLSQGSRDLENKGYGTNPKGFSPSIFNQWFDTFAIAKRFVIDNSKNLIGMQDSDIINAVSCLEKINMDLINIIKTIREFSTRDDFVILSYKLASINESLNKCISKLMIINMTLSNKKDAKNVVITIKKSLEEMVDRINKIVSDMINLTNM